MRSQEIVRQRQEKVLLLISKGIRIPKIAELLDWDEKTIDRDVDKIRRGEIFKMSKEDSDPFLVDLLLRSQERYEHHRQLRDAPNATPQEKSGNNNGMREEDRYRAWLGIATGNLKAVSKKLDVQIFDMTRLADTLEMEKEQDKKKKIISASDILEGGKN